MDKEALFVPDWSKDIMREKISKDRTCMEARIPFFYCKDNVEETEKIAQRHIDEKNNPKFIGMSMALLPQ